MSGWKSRTNAGIFIAASDSSAKDKAVADYVCDGVNDEVEVLAAIAALPATGGVIEFAPGTFIRGADIAITKGNLKIIGRGRSTIWKMKDSTNANAQIFSATSIDGIAIEDMIIDGNEANNTSGSQYGINFISCTNLNIDCWIENCRTADIIVNNIETCGKVRNRNYDDAYMPLRKLILDFEDVNDVITISGTATLADSSDRMTGDYALSVTIPASGEIEIEHAMVADLRFYPVLEVVFRVPVFATRLAPNWLKVTLIDSADNSISTEFSYYENFSDANHLSDGVSDGFAPTTVWMKAWIPLYDFVYSNNHSILGDVAKIRLDMKGRATSGSVIYLDSITAVRGMQRPAVTWIWDDARKCQYDYVAKMMAERGWAGVVAVNSHRVGETVSGGTDWAAEVYSPITWDVCTWDELKALQNLGWDVINHSASHVSTTYTGFNGIDQGYQSRMVWEWVAGRAALEAKYNFVGSQYIAHAGSHISNREYYFRMASVAARCHTYNDMCLPYAINIGFIPYTYPLSATQLAQLLKFHLWAVTMDHDMASMTDAAILAKADSIKNNGIEVLTFSDIKKRYPFKATKSLYDFGWKTHTDTFIDLLASDPDYVHSGIAGTGAAQNITSFTNQPDYPRSITISCTDVATPSGTVYVYGTDARGYLLSQKLTITAGGLVATTGAFATVTKVTIPATVTAVDTITVGIGDMLGLSHWILNYTDVLAIRRNGAIITVAPELFTIKNNMVSWEATVDLSTITAGDDVVIRYRTNM